MSTIALPKSILPAKLEQCGKHLRRQLDRDALDPIERLVARQVVEHVRGAPANEDRESIKMSWREHRRHGLAPRPCLGSSIAMKLGHWDSAFHPHRAA